LRESGPLRVEEEPCVEASSCVGAGALARLGIAKHRWASL